MKRTTLTSFLTAATIALSFFSAAPVLATSNFTPAATLAEAEATAKQTYGFIAYNGRGYYGKKIDKDLRLARLNKINKEVSRVLLSVSNFPESTSCSSPTETEGSTTTREMKSFSRQRDSNTRCATSLVTLSTAGWMLPDANGETWSDR